LNAPVTVLVTGGCGFIGSSLVRQLLDRGLEPRVLDNLSRGSADNLPAGVELVVDDIRNEEAVLAALEGVDAVVHLAAFGSVIESIADPLANFEVNVGGTLTILRACVALEVQRLVFASTGGALMGKAQPPVDESTLPWPVSPYGASKLCCEAYLHGFAGAYGLRATTLRFPNVYGPFSTHKTSVVTTFVKNALNGRPLVIYGDGSASRDFLFVGDLTGAICSALEVELEDEVVQLASEEETTVGELAELVRRVTGQVDLPIEHRPARRGEVERIFAAAEKARRVLGFAPAETLESGIEKTVAWFRESRSRWESTE
jgi:UDP-glucose 4-epimerase